MIYLVLATILFGILNLTAAAASRHLNTNIATLLINAVAVVVPLAVAIPAIAKKSMANEKFGIVMAIITGLLIGLYALAANKSYTLNKVSIVVPVIFGGSIFIAAIISLIVFKEKLNSYEIAGLVLVLLGLILIIFSRLQTGYDT